MLVTSLHVPSQRDIKIEFSSLIQYFAVLYCTVLYKQGDCLTTDYMVSSTTMYVRYRGSKSHVTAPRVSWGELTVQNVLHGSRQGVEDRGSGNDQDDVLLYDSTDQASLPSSSYTSHSLPLSVYSKEKMLIPVTFVWKGVTGHLSLHLIPVSDSTTSTSPSASTWSIRQRSHRGSEGADKDDNHDSDESHGVSSGDGRKMVTAILRSLSKSVFSLYQGMKNAEVLRQHKETTKKLK